MKTRFAIKMQFGPKDVRYFVGFDCGEEDWTMFLDSAATYTLAGAQKAAERYGFEDANVFSIVPASSAASVSSDEPSPVTCDYCGAETHGHESVDSDDNTVCEDCV